MKAPDSELRLRLTHHLQQLYPDHDLAALGDELLAAMGLEPHAPSPAPFRDLWDAGDVWMITYADSLQRAGEAPLHTLRRFLDEQLAEVVSGVHVLPFYPYSSDDGFAVSDYLAVREDLGDWSDIRALADRYRLMADLVINHCSAAHPWFLAYCEGRSPGAGYFVELEAGADLSAVVRPRTSPLLRPTETVAGLRHVWCTFSHDQIDLNFANPAVLREFVHIVRHYLDQGVRIFRLDAVAFLWKEPGSASLNLPQTHEIVRLLRTLVEHAEPGAVLITETNIPNRENLSYFGNANEAHLVYNFSLPPLMLHTLLTGDCSYLKRWLMSMPPARNGTTYLNFIASHDGIGLRPAEGLLRDDEVQALIDHALAAGGQVSWRALTRGERRPYEINISLFSALAATLDGPDTLGVERLLCAHSILLALEGVPAIYIHSLLATENDTARMARTGNSRSINRHQWDADVLQARLESPESPQARVLGELRRLIRIRARQPAFHPNATQFTLHLGEAVFGFWRQSMDRRQSIFALHNISREPQRVPLAELNLVLTDRWQNLISGRVYERLDETVELAPYECVWISNGPPAAGPVR